MYCSDYDYGRAPAQVLAAWISHRIYQDNGRNAASKSTEAQAFLSWYATYLNITSSSLICTSIAPSIAKRIKASEQEVADADVFSKL